jgi:hypothetical protein
VEQTCTQVVAMRRLLKQTLATVGWDVLQPTRVSPKMERRIFTWVFLAHSGFPDFLPLRTFLHNAWSGMRLRWQRFRRR